MFRSVCIILILANNILADLEAPKLLSVELLDEEGLYIVWEPVTNSTDPVVGYKIKLWEVKVRIEGMYKLVNAEQLPGLVKQFTPEDAFTQATVPPSEPKLYKVGGADTNSISIDYVKPGVLNEIRIFATTRNKEGPMSPPWRVQILESENKKGFGVVRHGNDMCVLSVPPEADSLSESIPTTYNIYL